MPDVKTLAIRLDGDLHNRLTILAKLTGISITSQTDNPVHVLGLIQCAPDGKVWSPRSDPAPARK